MKIKDEILLVVGGLLVFGLTIGVIIKESNSEWKQYQAEFTQLVKEKLGEKVAASVEPGLIQIWNPELKVTDRCKTCHMGIDIPGLEKEKQPFSTHPDLAFYKQTHPFKDFGCTTCHDGQGFSTKVKDAHGDVHHWMTPMYTKKVAADYGLENTKAMIEMNCNRCHRRDRQTENMPSINLAKQLLKEKNCAVCHIIKDLKLTIGPQGFEVKDRTIGPDLSYEGAKYPEEFGFDTVEGKKSVLNWHMEHFINPQKVSKDSLMINYTMTKEEARALSLLMMSWKKAKIPLEFIPSPYRSEITSPPKVVTTPADGVELDGKTLYKKWLCQTCHGDDGRSTTDAYPSLAGQIHFYLVNQIQDIKTGARKAGHSDVMKPLVQQLSDQEIDKISKYLDSLR